ncbi:MAG TPA: aldose epimerase family protein [Candidatus Saccharimonadales bacterium]|nr:aldose epimerase family protein [Candidatus Saccharimonadales bacterium]
MRTTDKNDGKQYMKINLQLITLATVGLVALGLTGCASMSKSKSVSESTGTITEAPFGKTADGTPVEIYTLRNSKGMEARIMTYGGIVQSLKVPDRDGHFGDVVLGYDNLEGYLTNSPFFGALIGRYANRIANGKFTLDGHEYTLPTNNPPNCLHGGDQGFDKKVWKVVKADVGPRGPRLELSYLSKDGEEGFPGNLNVQATYTVTEDNALRVHFKATTDQDTICNLTHHSYFNLTGSGDVLGYIVYINADKFTPVDSTLIPTGELRPVAGTPFDFLKPTAIGARINEDNQQLKYANGYDDNWVLNHPAGKLGLAAQVYDPVSGRVLTVYTTAPGMQFYTGNFLDGTITGKGGWVYQFRDAFAMEPQDFPDSPNHPNFPSAELKPGETYKSTIIYQFSTK